MLETHLAVHKAGRPVLMMDFEVSEIEKHIHARKIQSLYRYKKARRKFRELLAARFQRHWDANEGRFFYVNVITGESHWDRPDKLGDAKVAEAPDGWVEHWDENGNPYYYHARTGRYSWLTEEQAALRLQKLYRKKRLAVRWPARAGRGSRHVCPAALTARLVAVDAHRSSKSKAWRKWCEPFGFRWRRRKRALSPPCARRKPPCRAHVTRFLMYACTCPPATNCIQTACRPL